MQTNDSHRYKSYASYSSRNLNTKYPLVSSASISSSSSRFRPTSPLVTKSYDSYLSSGLDKKYSNNSYLNPSKSLLSRSTISPNSQSYYNNTNYKDINRKSRFDTHFNDKSCSNISSIVAKYLKEENKEKSYASGSAIGRTTFVSSLRNAASSFNSPSRSPSTNTTPRGSRQNSPALSTLSSLRSQNSYADRLNFAYEKVRTKFSSSTKEESNMCSNLNSRSEYENTSKKSSWGKHYEILSSRWAENTGSTLNTPKEQYSYRPTSNINSPPPLNAGSNIDSTKNRNRQDSCNDEQNLSSESERQSRKNQNANLLNKQVRLRKRSESRKKTSKTNNEESSSDDETGNSLSFGSSYDSRIKARRRRLQKSKMLFQVEKEDSWTHRGAIQAAEIIHRAKNSENLKISRQNSVDRKNDLVIVESENYGPQFSIEKVQKTSLKPSSLISDVSLVNSNENKEADEDTLTEEDFLQEEVFGIETPSIVNNQKIITADLDFCKANFDQSSSSISIPLIKNRRANMQIQILKMVKKSPTGKNQPIAKPRKSLLPQQQKSLKIENGQENLIPTTPITPKISVLHFERKDFDEEKSGRKVKNVEHAAIKTCKNCHKQMANQKNTSTSSVQQQKADKQQQTIVNNTKSSVMVMQTENPYHVSNVSNGRIKSHTGVIDNQREKSSGQGCDSADRSMTNGFDIKSILDDTAASKVENQSRQQSISVEQIIDLCIKPPKFEISIEPETPKFIKNADFDDRTSRLPLTNSDFKNFSSPPSSAKNLKTKLKITTENSQKSKKLSRSASLDQKSSSCKKNTALSISHLSVIDKLKSVDQEMLKLLTLGEELGASAPKTSNITVESRVPVVDARKLSSVTVEGQSLPRTDIQTSGAILKKSDSSLENQDSSSPSSFATASSQIFEYSFKNASEKPAESSYKRALRLLDEQQEALSATPKNSCRISNQSLRIRSALDQASTMIDEMLRLARVKHKEEKIQFKKAADELDKVYEQMKFEINSHKLKIVNNSNNDKKEQKENVKPENPSLELKFEKIVDKDNDQKMDYTKKWLDDDLKSLVNDRPDLLQFCSKKLDLDQKSVGSASAEVAAITNRERLHALRVPDLVPEEPSSSLAPILRPAPIHPLKRRQISIVRPRDIFTSSPPAHNMDRHSIQTHLHKNYRKSSTSDYQSSTSVILSLAQKDSAGGMVKKQVDVFDKMSDQDYESDRSYWSDNMAAAYSSINTCSNNGSGKILSFNVAGFVKKFESDEKMATVAKNGLSKQVTAEQARLETCIRGVKNACKMQARTVSLSRNGSTHSLPVFCVNTAGVNNRESSTISVGDSALVNKIDEYSSTVTPSSYCSLQRSGYGSARYDFQRDHEQRLQKMNDILNELSSVNCSNSCSSLNNDRRKVSPARQSLKVIPEYNEHYENINYSKEPARRDYKEEKRNDQSTSRSCSISTNENAPALPPRNFSKRMSWHESTCLQQQQQKTTVQPEHHHHQNQEDIYESIPILCEHEPKMPDQIRKIAGAASLDRHLNLGEILKEEHSSSNNNVKKQPLFKNLLQFFNRNSTTVAASAKIGETFTTTSIDKKLPAAKNGRILRKSHSDSQNRIGDFSTEKSKHGII